MAGSNVLSEVKCPYCQVTISANSILCANCKQNVSVVLQLLSRTDQIQPSPQPGDSGVPSHGSISGNILVLLFSILTIIALPYFVIQEYGDDESKIKLILAVVDYYSCFIIVISAAFLAKISQIKNAFILSLLAFLLGNLFMIIGKILGQGANLILIQPHVSSWTYLFPLSAAAGAMLELVTDKTANIKKMFSFTDFLKWFVLGQDSLEKINRVALAIASIASIAYNIFKLFE